MKIISLLLYFLIGFVAVNGFKLYLINQKLKESAQNGDKKPLSSSEANPKVMPFLPLVYLVVWMVCSGLFFAGNKSETIVGDALLVGSTWLVLLIVFEAISWLVLKHKHRLNSKSMYKDSQPWLALSYYAVVVSPLMFAFALSHQ